MAVDLRNRRQLVREVDARLRHYGNSPHGNKSDPLDELVYIILSAQTEAYSYRSVFTALASAFPRWTGILYAPEDQIVSVIRAGGLASKKARQIKGALTKIDVDFGRLSLDSLNRLSDTDAECYLLSLPGIGVKSAKCILLYAFNRAVFPTDTHVWRICRRLGLTPAIPKPIPALERQLEGMVPPDLRYTLHVNLVSHGQQICRTYWPKCQSCVLADLCPNAFKQDGVWGTWRQPKGAWAKAVAEVSQPYATDIAKGDSGEQDARK